MSIKLSICIPTYKRLEKLKRALDVFSSIDICNEVEVVIIDNCSGYNINSELNNYKERINNLKIFQNTINIGGNANIARCIEYANGDWVWILGDDDIPYENSIETILKVINGIEDTNIKLLKFSSELGNVEKEIKISAFNNLLHFIGQCKGFSNFLFISSGVINRSWYIENYIDILDNISSNCVQIWPIIKEMSNNEKCAVLFLNQKICKWLETENISWSLSVVYYQMLEAIYSIPSISNRDKLYIAKKWIKINLKKIILSIRDFYFNKHYSKKECDYYYYNFCNFLYGKKSKIFFLFFVLINPLLYIKKTNKIYSILSIVLSKNLNKPKK